MPVGEWIPDPDAPSGWRYDEHDLGGDVSATTDEEWRDAHLRLIRDLAGVVNVAELSYVWAPGIPAGLAVPPRVVDAPAAVPGPDDPYDPDVDERFAGGGFRGHPG